jgi:hypothetical protein
MIYPVVLGAGERLFAETSATRKPQLTAGQQDAGAAIGR